MLELCPCLDALFPDTADEVALRILAGLGFRQFELWDWRAHDLTVLRQAREEFGLRPAVFSGTTFAESLLTTQAYPATLAHLRESLDVAARLGVTMLVVHVGYAEAGRSEAAQWRAAVGGLRAAGDLASQAGLVLLVEPLNSRVDHPGYFLDSLPDAHRLIREVGRPSVRLLLDIYHMWLMHPDLFALLDEVMPAVAHVHVADVPGRHEPGTGTIPWADLTRRIGVSGYAGLIGLEYWPSTTPADSLGRTRQLLAHATVKTV